jgi:hypothetical protein
LGRNHNNDLCAIAETPKSTERFVVSYLRQGCLLSADIGDKLLSDKAVRSGLGTYVVVNASPEAATHVVFHRV